MTATTTQGAPLTRVEGIEKVTGAARYAYEYPAEGVAYAWPVLATVARGSVTQVDVSAARSQPGVLAVLWHGNAPALQDTGNHMLAVLQSPRVAFRGDVVALVVADTQEEAREAAAKVDVTYDVEAHDVVLTDDHPTLYTPDELNAGFETDTLAGDPDAAFGSAAVTVDATYSTPGLHNNAMEPHATTATWEGDRLTLHDSNQGGHAVQSAVAKTFGLDPSDVRVVSAHVGGGFGSKGTPRPSVVLAAMAAREVGRPVRLALTRQMMFSLVGYRTPTIQRLRLGADADGRLVSISHDVVEQTATVQEFAEQTATATRMMYAGEHRRTTHRLARLDVPITSWLRAPGECPGMFALESAMDELALAAGVDPVELRILNEPDVDPESGLPFSSRNLVACLRQGAERFGWAGRDPRPGSRREGRWLVGTGVAASTYPAYASPATARAVVDAAGSFVVSVNATDIGTGARTALLQLAAEALGVPVERVRVQIGDTDLPQAGVAGGSMGTASWGWAVTKACTELRRCVAEEHAGAVPADGLEVTGSTKDDIAARKDLSRHAFGAHFVEVRVDVDTGEVRVPRMTGVFAAGRIVNARTARSQFIGGMTMGLSMALFEEGVMDAGFGDYANHDLAQYHVAACADVGRMDVTWVDEIDEHLNPMGIKGIGEIGIVGAAAAVANAVHHATGVRVRDLPVHVEDLLAGLPEQAR